MTTTQQFLYYNLLPSLAAGGFAWVVIYAAIKFLRINYSPYRLTLLFMPLVKSVLILLGIGLVLPWPREVFEAWHARALPFNVVLPYVIIWAGLVVFARSFTVQRARKLTLRNAEPAEQLAPRLIQSRERVMAAYESCPVPVVGEGVICCVNADVPRPILLVSESGLDSPLVLTNEEEPIIVFPLELITRLDDDKLDGALAHELAHFLLRNPAWCSPTNVNCLTPVSPIAGLVVAQLEREEEKACDDMAVTVLGKPEVYADMLLGSYRFSTGQANPLAGRMKAYPQLLGFKPMLTERVERLLRPDEPQGNLRLQLVTTCIVSIGAFILFFSIN